jgi:hypothetical protein
MPVIKNSSRAFLAAFLVLAAYHGLVTALHVSALMPKRFISPDEATLIFAKRILLDGALLCAGHWILRSFKIARRAAYTSMGAAALGIGYAIALTNNMMLIPPPDGAHLTGAALPMTVGAIAASIYAHLAGREIVATQQIQTNDGVPTPAAPIQIFDGPIQVRTSGIAILIASFIPACAIFMLSTLFLFKTSSGADLQKYSWQLMLIGIGTYALIVTLIMTVLPSVLVVGVTHAVARAMNRSHVGDYAAIGAVVGLLGAFVLLALTGTVPLLVAAPIAGALMGATYRKFAGIEPLPLHEAVLATDENTLVGADHPSRKGHAVIMNG